MSESRIPIPDVFEAFRERSEIAKSFSERSDLGIATLSEKSEAERTIGELDNMLLGEKVVATRLDSMDMGKDQDPIQQYTELNVNYYHANRFGRTREKQFDGRKYEPRNFSRYPKKAKGRVVGLEPDKNVIIIKPSNLYLRFFDRIWVSLIDEEGRPLVDLRYII